MPTFVLGGVTISFEDTIAGPTQFTITVPENANIVYQYSNETNNPGFATSDFGSGGLVSIPEVWFGPENSPVFVSPYGEDENDELYIAELILDTNGDEVPDVALTILSIFDVSTGIDHAFILSSSDPTYILPTDPAGIAALQDQIIGVLPVTSGPFAPGTPLDFSAVFPATLIATSDNDIWIGSDEPEDFDGGAGDDALDGAGGDDALFGGEGNDTLLGGEGADYIIGGPGDDTIDGGPNGIDGDIFDVIDYNEEAGPNGVFVNLETGIATDSFGDTDIISGVEAVAGTALADTLIGDANDNIFGSGNGADFIDGRDGIDEVDFEYLEDGPVFVDLSLNTATDSWGNTDTIINVENVFGSIGDDTIIGDDGDNLLAGNGGNDSLEGGAGNDTVRIEAFYSTGDFTIATTGGVTVVTNTVSGEADTLSNVEFIAFNDITIDLTSPPIIATEGPDDLVGTPGDDTIDGLGGDDNIEGGAGNDSLIGGDGEDWLDGGAGDDTLRGDAGFDYIVPGAGTDLVDGGEDGAAVSYDDSAGAVFVNFDTNTVIETAGTTDTLINIFSVRGSLYDDSMIGSSANEIFMGLGGDDVIEGGDGIDLVRYDRDFRYGGNGAVVVDLELGTATDGFGTNDILSGIENVRGTENDDMITGDAAMNELDGRGGNDTLIGGAGEDWLRGGAGHDSLSGGDGRDNIDAGDGDDTIDASGGSAASQGFGDIISAGLGNNTVIGHQAAFEDRNGGGVDMIFEDIGGATGGIYLEVNGATGTGYAQGTGSLTFQMSTSFTYADHFEGSMGADQMIGSDFGSGPDQSNESWVGEAGNDTIDGGGGFDLVQYNLEFDGTLGVMVNLETGVATDRFGDTDSLINIEGAAGTDMADTIIGSAVDNYLNGRGGDDVIDGGAGDDVIVGGGGHDTIEGGDGDDTLRIAGHAADYTIETVDDVTTITATIMGFDDTLRVTGVEWIEFADETIELAPAVSTTPTEGPDSLTGTDGDDLITGLGGNDTISGGAGNDTLIDGAGDDSVSGGTGDDLIYNTTGNDTYDGGAGSDTMFADLSDFTPGAFILEVNFNTGYSGQLGNPTLSDSISNFEAIHIIGPIAVQATGDAANNLFATGSGDDTLSGGAGDDRLLGGAGADTIDGGLGNDSLVGESGNDTLDGLWDNDTLIGGAGFDRLIGGDGDDSLSGGDQADNLFGDAGNDTLSGDDGNDRLFGDTGDDSMSGGQGADLLIGDDGNDTLDGGDDDDRLFGGAGDDQLSGGAGADTLAGGAGDDDLAGGDGDDDLSGDWQNDTLDGGLGNDTLDGGVGFDLLFGGEGDDSLSGGAQADNLFGDAGNDTLNGEDGNDRLFAGAGDDLLSGGEGRELMFGDEGADTLDGGADNDRLFGGDGNDDLAGGAGDDQLFGEAGNDLMAGGADADMLLGGTGNDTMSGDDGDDVLAGGAGFDRLTGGAGNDELTGNFNWDVFIFADGHGQDTITDFEATNRWERIDLSGVTALDGFANYTALAASGAVTTTAGGVLIDTGGGNSILLSGVDIGDLDNTDFIF